MNAEQDPAYTPCHTCQLPTHADRATWRTIGNDLVPLCEKCAQAPAKAARSNAKAPKTKKTATGPGERPAVLKWRLYEALRHERGMGEGYWHCFLRVLVEGNARFINIDLCVDPSGTPYPDNVKTVHLKFPSIADEVFSVMGRTLSGRGAPWNYTYSSRNATVQGGKIATVQEG